MKEFLGFGGYQRIPEGKYTWQHLTFVLSLIAVMIALAVCLGIYYRHKDAKRKNKVLTIAAIMINAIEIFKIVMFCWRGNDPMGWLTELPLFLCSIQLITIPLAAWSKGRLKEAALDFVMIFGILGAIFGTIGAAQNYDAYPVLSLDNVASGITHCISGFCSLYIIISGMASMKKKNIWITFCILLGFCAAAYVANILIDYNYMFLMNHDGTPYQIVYNWVGGHPVLYPLAVIVLFLVYIVAYYGVYFLITKKKTAVLEDLDKVEDRETVNV